MKIKKETWRILLVLFLIILSFLDLIPYICGYNYYYDIQTSKFYTSLNSSIYNQSVVFIIGVTIPLFLEILIDIRYINLDLVFPRILVVGGLLLTQSIFYFSEGNITLYMGLYRARGLALAGGLIIFLFESHSTKYDKIIGGCTVFTGIFYTMFTTWADLKKSETYSAVLFVFRVLAGLELVLLCLWYYTAAYKERDYIMTSTSRKLTLAYTLILASYFFLIYGIWFIYGAQAWENIGSHELICYNLIEGCSMLAAIIVPARLLRLESHANEIELARKRNFVGYVSHEVRSPLNAISVGLELLTASLNSIERSFHLRPSNDESNSKKYFKFDQSSESLNIIHSLQSLVSDISLSCSSSIDILDDLLLFDNIESGSLILRKQCVPILYCIERWSKPFRIQAQQNSIKFQFEQNNNVNIHVYIDLVKVAQAFRNIVNNAFEYTPQGGTITIRSEKIEKEDISGVKVEYVRIEVIDTGCGIAKELQPSLFLENRTQSADNNNINNHSKVHPFQPTVFSDRKKGYPGLGLFLAATIIRKHEGNIGVESTGISGQGSIFYIELKTVDPNQVEPNPNLQFMIKKPDTESKAEEQVENFHNSNSGSSSSPPPPHSFLQKPAHLTSQFTEISNPQIYHRALVVDDSLIIRKMLSKSLFNRFQYIEHASDGVEAVNAVKRLMNEEEVLNVIFLDSYMPNMGGIEACKQIRSLGYSGVIVAISGNVIPEDIQEFLAAGADKFLGKPITLEQLQTTLEELNWRLLNPNENSLRSGWYRKITNRETVPIIRPTPSNEIS